MSRLTRMYALAALLLPSLVSAQALPREYPATVATTSTAYAPPTLFSFDQLLRILAEPKTASVDELVERLPASYRENYVEIFASRSPERGAVSAKAPRIVSFGHDAKVIIAFCGDPTDRETFGKIQILRFNDDHKRWEFYTTTVPAARDANGTMTPLEKNPAKCLSCHGAGSNPPGPIWDSYPLWPGVYGADRDSLFLQPAAGRSLSYHNVNGVLVPAEEKEPMLRSQYLSNKPTLKRYRLLREHLGNRNWDRQIVDAMNQPNSTLTMLLLLRQSEFLARAIRENSSLLASRFAILASLTGKYVYSPQAAAGPGFRIASKESGLAGIDTLRFSYPPELFSAQGPTLNSAIPSAVAPSRRDFSRELASFDLESTAAAIDRHFKLIGSTAASDPISVTVPRSIEEVLMNESITIQKIPRLMTYLEVAGMPARSWALDFEKRFTNNDGDDTFVNNLERRLWAEIIDDKAMPALSRLYRGALEFRPIAGTPLLWGGRPIDCFENLANEVQVRRQVCDLLREETNKLYPVRHVPAYPLAN